ncbi:uncharacterized protein LOC134719157 isoform X2 [Mytilus trossulus]
MFTNEENDSLWLYDVLDYIGANEEFRKTCRCTYISAEIMATFDNVNSFYYFGSLCEGAFTPGHAKDEDTIECMDRFPIIEDILKDNSDYDYSLLMITESYTPVGYFKLQFVIDGIGQTEKDWPNLQQDWRKEVFQIDIKGRLVLSDLSTVINNDCFSRQKNKPALTNTGGDIDLVRSYRCRTWPTIANEWLTRRRCNGWPTDDAIQEMKLFGFFVIKKGHPFSKEIDLEWRISFSLQERQLMFSLTDVQHKCYIVLKMLNQDIIKLKEFTSYHWKTCLFYVIEENDNNVWEKKQLFNCVKLCIKQMLKWVNCGFCPNYFIPGDNLFDGKMNNNLRLNAATALENILSMGFDCFLHVQSNNICRYVESRKSPEQSQLLQSQSIKAYREHMIELKLYVFKLLAIVFNYRTLQLYYNESEERTDIFIKLLWEKLRRIERTIELRMEMGNVPKRQQRDSTVTYHGIEITKFALGQLKPHILNCLASSISAMAIQHPNQQVRDFLLFGSFTLFRLGGLIGRMKFVSVLYAIGLLTDCEWFIDELNVENTLSIPSLCFCRDRPGEYEMTIQNVLNNANEDVHVVTCIYFLPSELKITPHGMKNEMFRHCGTSVDDTTRSMLPNRWHYRAVVDCNTFFVYLKYLIKQDLNKLTEAGKAFKTLNNFVVIGSNVKHVDVGHNLIALHLQFLAPYMLSYLRVSWSFTTRCWEEITNSDESKKKDLKILILGGLNRTQYQFNAAKLHALVLLYNTWFAKERPHRDFCFNCFLIRDVEHLTCSLCQIATYCSPQCQRENCTIHKEVCRIVLSRHK